MKQKESYVFKLAERWMKEDKAKKEKLRAMDKMWKNEFNLPKSMSELETTLKVVDSSPSDALETASRTFSTKLPKITYLPLGPSPQNKETANKIERGLTWELFNADKRSMSSIVADAMRSALRYDAVCFQLIHLPSHYDALGTWVDTIEDKEEKKARKDILKKKRKAALRKGDFIISVRNPQNVCARVSDLGLEGVLLVQNMTARDIYARWEGRASFLKKKGVDGQNDDWEDKMWTYYDFEDLNQRMVWVNEPNAGATAREDYVILNEENPVPFISWAIREGGTILDPESKDRVNPYLNNVFTSGSWELSCKLQTLIFSEGVKYASGPTMKTTTPTGEGIDVEYGGDQTSMDLRPGEDAEPWIRPPLDQALLELFDRTRANIDAQTRVRVLQNPDFPAGTAFATINALLNTALNGLHPWRELAEKAFADMFELMLLWVDYSGLPISAWGTTKDTMGKQYTIEPKDFDPYHIYIAASLEADVATSKIEELNAAVMMHERLGWPKADLYEKLGEQDPQQLRRDRYFEDMMDNEVGIRLERRNAMEQMKMEQMMQEQAMIAQQAAQQAQMMAQTGGGGLPQQQPMGGPGMEAAFGAMQGEGFNPAMQGTPPAIGFPPGTREEVTGVDVTGAPLEV